MGAAFFVPAPSDDIRAVGSTAFRPLGGCGPGHLPPRVIICRVGGIEINVFEPTVEF